jgi:microcystin-dependent protein
MAIYLFKGKSKLERSHIGQIIMSTTLNTQAKVIEQYGGTSWTKIEGRFLLGASSSYPVNATGGEATHTLTIDEMPSHTHNLKYELNARATGGSPNIGTGTSVGSEATTSTGGGQPHNNMPPYKAVYIWERTA